MSMIERAAEPLGTMAEPWDDIDPSKILDDAPHVTTPIVPKSSISGRSLVAVVSIMTFLASLTTGAVMLIRTSASDWQSDVAREVTIQIRPAPGRDTEADVRKAADIARAAAGIAEVRPYTKEESAKLIEPWLGTGLVLDDLPIPRLIVVRMASGATPDFVALRKALAAEVPEATLDDHRRWIDRMRTMADTAVAGGLGVLALVLVVTVLSVSFATRGAMATNRPIVEVLHFIGATDGFVAGQFQRHFLMLGLKGGAIGGGAAIVMFGLVQVAGKWLAGTAGGDEAAALFGSLAIGPAYYIAVLGQIGLMALVTGWTSRQTVNRTLDAIE
jgi:cell division transport system permease protein